MVDTGKDLFTSIPNNLKSTVTKITISPPSADSFLSYGREVIPTLNYPLTPTDIRNGGKDAIVQLAVKAIDEKISPNADTAKTLISWMFEDMQRGYDWEDGLLKIPYPESAKKVTGYWKSTYDLPVLYRTRDEPDEYLPEGVSKTFPKGLVEWYDDGMKVARIVVFETLRNLKPEYQEEAIEWLLTICGKYPVMESLDIAWDIGEFVKNSTIKEKLMPHLMDFIWEHKDEYNFAWPGSVRGSDVFIDELMSFAVDANSDLGSEYLTYISKLHDKEKMRTFLGMFVNSSDYPRVINLIQEMVKAARVDSEERKNLEKVGRMLYGKDPDDTNIPFLTAASELYKLFPLEKYKYLEDELPKDLDVTRDILSEIKESGSIVELGSGTGRVTKKLAEEREEEIIGVEILDEYVEKARQADETHKVIYKQADWTNTGLPDNSVKLVLSLGRSLMAADEKELEKVAQEVKRLGGRFLFSYGYPDSPKYKRDKQTYLDILKKINALDPDYENYEEAIDRLDVIISSSDGTHWSNRYCYDQQTLKKIFKSAGLKLSTIMLTDIKGLEGAYSIYYYAEPEPESKNDYMTKLADFDLNT